MTLAVSDVARDVFAYIGRPSESAFPQRDLYDVGSRKVTSIILDLHNADRDYRVALYPLTTAQRDTVFPHAGEIVRLEGRDRASVSDDEWVEWQRDDRFRVYGSPAGTRIVFSEDPSTYTFRVLVERGSVRLSSLADDTTLSELVQPLLFTRWALEAGAMVDDDSERWDKMWARKERHLRLELPGLERQWKAYVERNRGEGIAYKDGFQGDAVGDVSVYQDATGRLRAT